MHQTLNAAFPIVAAALGHRLGVRVLVQGQSARTDGGMIIIPAYDGNDPHYREVAWGYLAHEAAHLRYTDFDVFRSACTHPLRKSILNILEDVRIEKRMAQSYPGTQFTIEKTVARLIPDGGYCRPSDPAHPAVLLEAHLLFGLRFRVLGQTGLKAMATDARLRLASALPDPVFERLESLLETVDYLMDTQEALSLTDRILAMFEKDRHLESCGAGEARQGMETSKIDRVEAHGGPSSWGEAVASDEAADYVSPDGHESVQSSKLGCSSLTRLLNAEEADLLGDLFDQVREGLSLGLEQTSGITLPVADEPPTDPLQGRTLLNRALTESGKLRASLQGFIQAHRLSKPVTGRSGSRMDPSRLSRLGWNDPRVFRQMAHRKVPNTAVHILVDRSPSMSALVAQEGNIIGRRSDLAWEATISLALALEGIQGVNVGITAFPGKDGEASSVYTVMPHGLRLRNRVASLGGDLDGSTPLAEAIWFAGCQLLRQREVRKLLLVLTDGIPDDLEAARNVLVRSRISGIEVTGIGLGIEVDSVFERAICVLQIGDLARQLLEVCRTLLTEA